MSVLYLTGNRPRVMEPDDDLLRRLDAARRRAVPVPWAPPMPDVDWLPFRKIHRRLIAEAVAQRLAGLTPALESVDLDGCAFEIERVIRILEAVPLSTAEVA